MIELKVNIDGQEKAFSMPSGWDEVSIGTFEKIANCSVGDNELQESIEILGYVTGMDDETLYALPIDQVPVIMEQLKYINEPISNEPKEFVEVGGEKYYFKQDFDKLTTGEVLSIDMLNQKYEEQVYKGIAEMLCVFLRKKIDGKLESFRKEHMERAEAFRKEVMIADVYQLFVFFFKWKDNVFRNYKGLFGSGRTKDRYESLAPTEIDPKWGNFVLIERMIEGLNMTKNEVFENNYLDTLNWLSYWKEKDKVRENLNKRQ